MLKKTEIHAQIPFEYEIEVEKANELPHKDERTAVRGVALRGNKILVVYTDDLLYGTPGGGVEENEDLLTSLKRELLEEVGALSFNSIEYLGKINEIRPGIKNDTVFNPLMHYYLVDIKEHGEQQLIEYEQELNLRYDYIDINEAIKQNEKILSEANKPYSWFYVFQTELFKIVKDLKNL